MKNLFITSFLCLVILCSTQCKKNSAITPTIINTPDTPNPNPVRPYKFLVTNEGNFGRGTASLSGLINGNFENDIFRTKSGRPLGDIAQSIAVANNKIYVTLNASAKIEVLNLWDFKSITTITSTQTKKTRKTKISFNPQYIIKLNDTAAAVSDLYTDFVSIIDTRSDTIMTRIDIGDNSGKRQMAVANNKLFVSTSKLSVIPIDNHWKKTGDIFYSARASSKLVVDKNKNLWIITSKNLVCINSTTEKVVKTIPLTNLTIDGLGGRLEINFTADSLFFNADNNTDNESGIYVVSIDDSQIPTRPLFVYSKKIQLLYNIGVSREKTIYICDALDFVQRGIIYEFAQNGTMLHKYTAGIIPQYLYFF